MITGLENNNHSMRRTVTNQLSPPYRRFLLSLLVRYPYYISNERICQDSNVLILDYLMVPPYYPSIADYPRTAKECVGM